jgi:hypothetical protein
MKYFEFRATVNEQGMLPVPQEVVAGIGSYRTVYVTLVADESEKEEAEAWQRLAMEAFL